MRHTGFVVLLVSVCVLVTACTHSHVINVTVTNTSPDKISTIVIDYPEATFGINTLESGKNFQYKIKPTATGPLKIAFLNAQGIKHASTGPVVHTNDEGSIQIKLTQEAATAEASIR